MSASGAGRVLAVVLSGAVSACSARPAPVAAEPGPPPDQGPPPGGEPAPEEAMAEGRGADATPDEPVDWLVLHDIQGLYGGRAIYLAGDGAVVLRVVRPVETGLRESRTTARWPAARVAELRALLVRHDVATMVVPDRPGIPDEAYARLTVRWRSGREREVGKWDGVRHDGFTAVYGRLMGWLEETTAQARPGWEGEYDHEWAPPGPWAR